MSNREIRVKSEAYDENYDITDSIVGCIIGTAVGDSLGLCCEGLSNKRQNKLFGRVDRHHFIFGRGMVSDDTEHTCMVAQALIVSKGDADIFCKFLAKQLKRWLRLLPAGIGFATLRSILKLCIGISPYKSGVFSAGNGPAMRSSIIGVCYGNDKEKLKVLVRISTRITHIDPKAEYGALAVAAAAHMAASKKDISPDEYYCMLRELLEGYDAEEFLELIKKVIYSVNQKNSTASFAKDIGLEKGVSGYIYHTVPIVIHCWLNNQEDLFSAITEIISCGGDTDTTAAILGGIMGSRVGKQGIPSKWIDGILEWPCNVKWMEILGTKLAENINQNNSVDIKLPSFYKLAIRNFFFTIVVLLHGFRRLLPPY